MRLSKQRKNELQNFIHKHCTDITKEADKIYKELNNDNKKIYDLEDIEQELLVILMEFNLTLIYSSINTASILFSMRLKQD